MSGRQAFFIQKILEPIAMGILKAFIGGLVGAMIATVVLMVLRDGSLRGYEWFPLVTGLLTGLGARLLAGSTGRSLATGIVAAVIAMLAILSGDELLQLMKMRNADLGPLRSVAQRESTASQNAEAAANEPEDGEAAGDSTDAAADNSEEAAVADGAQSEEAAARSSIAAASGTNSRPPVQRPKTLKDFLPYIFAGLGVLIAYNLGRGTPPAKVVSEDPAPSASAAVEEAAS